MEKIAPVLANTFGNRTRVRVCGICCTEAGVLLADHKGMGVPALWMPPGGGLDFGEPVEDALVREFKEETGLAIKVGKFMFLYEVMNPPFHAIELFFEVEAVGGTLETGKDPEIDGENQALRAVKWISWEEIAILPNDCKHHLFNYCRDTASLRQMAGFYTLWK